MVGTEVEFLFSDEWKPLIKTAVFIAGSQKRVVLEAAWRDNICTIPHECLAAPDVHLLVGVYGTNAGGSLVIPTVYADLGMIWTGADTDGETGAEASPELWAQLQAQLDLKESTENKVTFLSEASTDEQYPSAKAAYEAIAAGGTVVIEGTASDDMSEVTITTPDAWTMISEAWNSEKRPLVVLRLNGQFCAYLSCVSYADGSNGETTGLASFSFPPGHLLDDTPPYSIWMYEDGEVQVFEVQSLNGAAGAAGRDGYTPVRGTDYWTADDIAAIQSYIDEKAAALQPKSITDSGGHFTTDTVEGALQEIGAELAGINTLLGSGIQISFTIDDGGSSVETYNVVNGTTWAEWIGTGRLVFNDSLVLYIYGGVVATEAGVYALSLDGSTAVSGSDTIISGATYTIISCGG